jgi:hypothetical protein
MHVTYTH